MSVRAVSYDVCVQSLRRLYSHERVSDHTHVCTRTHTHKHRYANRARNIQNKAVKNLDAQSAEMLRLNQLVSVLKYELVKAKFGSSNSSSDGVGAGGVGTSGEAVGGVHEGDGATDGTCSDDGGGRTESEAIAIAALMRRPDVVSYLRGLDSRAMEGISVSISAAALPANSVGGGCSSSSIHNTKGGVEAGAGGGGKNTNTSSSGISGAKPGSGATAACSFDFTTNGGGSSAISSGTTSATSSSSGCTMLQLEEEDPIEVDQVEQAQIRV